jgi:hypothetical protein
MFNHSMGGWHWANMFQTMENFFWTFFIFYHVFTTQNSFLISNCKWVCLL